MPKGSQKGCPHGLLVSQMRQAEWIRYLSRWGTGKPQRRSLASQHVLHKHWKKIVSAVIVERMLDLDSEDLDQYLRSAKLCNHEQTTEHFYYID